MKRSIIVIIGVRTGQFLLQAVMLFTFSWMLLLEDQCLGQTVNARKYVVFGRQRAISDCRNNLYYAYNDFAFPLVANVQTKEQENLLKGYFRVGPMVQKEYLTAFISGYRAELLHRKGNLVITKSPLIATLIEMIQRYAREHHDTLPPFQSTQALVSIIKKEDIGADPYAGTKVRYAVNKQLAGKSMASFPSTTVLAWEISGFIGNRRYVGFVNGDIRKLSSAQWNLLREPRIRTTAASILVASVRQAQARSTIARLTAKGIDAGASCDLGTCGIYVSRRNARRAERLLRHDTVQGGP